MKKKDIEYGSLCYTVGFPRWLRGKESACNAVDPCSVSGLGRSLGRQPTPVFLPGESHGQRSLADYSPQCCKELDTTEVTLYAHMCYIVNSHCLSVLYIAVCIC